MVKNLARTGLSLRPANSGIDAGETGCLMDWERGCDWNDGAEKVQTALPCRVAGWP